MATRTEELELDTDDSFQRIEWRIQRIGWVMWMLVIAAGLIGLLGSGPMSETTTAAPDNSLTIEYDRFLHYHHPTQLRLSADATADTELKIKFDRTLLNCFQVERIEPDPLRSELTNDGVIYTFAKLPSQTAIVTFHIDYEHVGASSGIVEVVGHDPVVLTQFVYP